jgi:hypothetical protein
MDSKRMVLYSSSVFSRGALPVRSGTSMADAVQGRLVKWLNFASIKIICPTYE